MSAREILMASARFTLRLEPELKDWLEQEAHRQERSAGFLANKAIASLRQDTEAKRSAIQDAMAEAEKGEFISEAMTAWFLSLGTENELPEPQPDVFVRQGA
jgi:predicted transcriptional regulator